MKHGGKLARGQSAMQQSERRNMTNITSLMIADPHCICLQQPKFT